MHQKHLLYVPRNAPTMDSRRGITVPAAAVAEVVADTLLMETALRGVRGADHQDGHPTTIQTDFSEEDPQDHLAEALRAVGPGGNPGLWPMPLRDSLGPKRKEADKISLLPMPTIASFRSWKIALRNEVAGASGDPD